MADGLNNGTSPSQEEESLLKRIGPQVRDYFIEFLDYLRARTGFRPQHFRAPTELQRTMERMETISLPMTIWNTCINGSVRLIAMSGINIESLEAFIGILIRVLGVVIEFFVDKLLLKILFGVIAFFGIKELTAIAIFIYHFISFSAKKLWAYVEKALEKYLNFALKKVQIHFNNQSMTQ